MCIVDKIKPMLFKFKNRSLLCDGKTYIVGIVNVTPDSFSDGARYLSSCSAVEHCLELLDSGADIIDIGGESTRPGAETVSAEEELRRILPVICEIRKLREEVVISVDTMKRQTQTATIGA